MADLMLVINPKVFVVAESTTIFWSSRIQIIGAVKSFKEEPSGDVGRTLDASRLWAFASLREPMQTGRLQSVW